MHAYSLWWRLLGGSSHKAPTSQGKAQARTRHGTKKKSKKQADCDRRATAPSATKTPGTGGQQHGARELPDVAVLDAGGDGVVQKLLKAVGIRRLKAMTSRSRVCGNPKYKVNSHNLQKFEQLLAKIPEGEKRKGTTSLTSLPERHEDASRMPAPSLAPHTPASLSERPVPDISPSMTMGSSVTAEYELFCKAFHSEAKELLPEEEQQKVCSNPMRQMLQQASEAASRGLQLQRVTSAFEATECPRDAAAIDETNRNEATTAPEMVAALAGQQSMTGSVTELSTSNPPQPASVPSREQPAQHHQDQQHSEPRHQRSKHHSRRWSENPVGTPIFMAKKFAEKLSQSKEAVTNSTVEAREHTPEKSSASLLKALKPKLPFSSPKSVSKPSTPPLKQPSKPGVGGHESAQPSTSLSTPKHHRSHKSASPKKHKP